jgi:hypothetical protein
MAYVSAKAAEQAAGAGEGHLAVDIRGSAEPAELMPLPFYRRPA